MSESIELKNVVQMDYIVDEYTDKAYLEMIETLQRDSKEILTPNLGSEFVKNCSRDLAGEVVRNFFDTTDYHITVDQLALRITKFQYDNDYDPIKENKELQKKVYAQSDALFSAHPTNFDKINQDMLETMNSPKSKLFNKETVVENGKEKRKYEDRAQIEKGKKEYRKANTDENGVITDEYTGRKGDYHTDKNGKKYSNEEVDHVQAAATAKYDYRHLKGSGKEALKEFYNSEDNFAMMDKVANQSKGDVRVYDEKGNDITYKATPKQMADAVCERWEGTSEETKQKLKDKGYLNEDGKVPESVKKELEGNIRHSQNEESKVILKHTDYLKVGADAGILAVKSLHKIIAGQFLYYGVPPLIYEIRMMLQEKNITLQKVLDRLPQAGKRVCNYVKVNLQQIFRNIAESTITTFLRAFMDILISMVKATIQKLLQMAKRLLMSTVSAIKIIADKTSTRARKADAIFNLYGVTVTGIVIDLLFDYLTSQVPIPEPIIYPLQILTTIVCTNLVMLILKELDLFDVQSGFKIQRINELFAVKGTQADRLVTAAQSFGRDYSSGIIDNAKAEVDHIESAINHSKDKHTSLEDSMEKIDTMFGTGKQKIDWNQYE